MVPVDIHKNGVAFRVSYHSEKGGRPYQEDRLEAIGRPSSGDRGEIVSVYGVFDGHGGSRASQYCTEKLLQYVLNDDKILSDPKAALRNAFYKTDAEFSAIARVRSIGDGTTAIVAVLLGGKVYVANAGDSRCILVHRSGAFTALSDDHKPNRADEEARIKRLGGRVVHWGRWRVNGVLAVSRAIGDVPLQPFVTCEPEIVERDLGTGSIRAGIATSSTVATDPADFLVLASDGVWDVMENKDVARFLHTSARASANAAEFVALAQSLCCEAIILGSQDNITAMVVDLRYSGNGAKAATGAGPGVRPRGVTMKVEPM